MESPEVAYLKYIDNLPLVDDVEVFGLHQNANVTFQTKESKDYLKMLRLFEPNTISTTDVDSAEQEVMNFI